MEALTSPQILSPLRLPFRHRPEVPDSTADPAILHAIRRHDWECLGELLGTQEPELARLIAAWPTLALHVRETLDLILRSTPQSE